MPQPMSQPMQYPPMAQQQQHQHQHQQAHQQHQQQAQRQTGNYHSPTYPAHIPISEINGVPSPAQQSPSNAPSPTMSTSSSGKKPKLRVQIPDDRSSTSSPHTQQQQQQRPGHQHQLSISSISSTSSAVNEEVPEQRPIRPHVFAEPAPPSALPSQFAQNLPSPSTFYPEFYQQSELPSPLNFSATPTTGAFHWPPTTRDYKPSPLKIRSSEKRGHETEEELNAKSRKTKS
ncbi:hypothetical protein BDF14DRAFT_622435 [Spinellus fusiger]|nr:hypothetical protein BDF14DRAFT_622435 [Spinellus fusiger]